MIKLGDLSNDELIARLRAHVGRGNEWLVGLLAFLAEVDARRLYAEHVCTSMWDFCVRRLGMSEGEANRRIAAARVLRQSPLARGYLERGAIHLCAVYELHKHLTEENHEELLREASGKSTKAVAEMIAARFPRPDVRLRRERFDACAANLRIRCRLCRMRHNRHYAEFGFMPHPFTWALVGGRTRVSYAA